MCYLNTSLKLHSAFIAKNGKVMVTKYISQSYKDNQFINHSSIKETFHDFYGA